MTRPVIKPVILLVPPVGDCTMPMLGPHTLAGYLKAKGIPCRVYDASMELLWLAASPAHLRAAAASSATKDKGYLASLVETGLDAMLRCEDRLQTLVAGLKLFSVLHGTFKLSADDITLPFPVSTVADLSQAISAVEPLIRLIEATSAFSNATATDGAVVGISVSFPSQLILSIAMCQVIRRRQPKNTIVLGGAYFGTLGFQADDLLKAFDYIDMIVCGSGELPLEALARGDETSRIAGATLCVDSRIIVTAQNMAPADPDFSDVEWGGYTSGVRVMPFTFATTCYYGRCRFCNGDKGVTASSGRSNHVEVERLRAVVKRNGIECVYIVDAAISPAELKHIASALAGDIRWAANARPDGALAEKGLLRTLRDSGCWMLRFGFESGSQRILDAMAKGTRTDHVSRVLTAAAAVGIKSHLYIMLGYPGENDADREETVGFLREHKDYIYSHSISIFQAIPGTAIYHDLCETLAVDSEDHQRATACINALLYPSEEVYARLTNCIEHISCVLRGASKTNRLCYSGRIFCTPDTPNSGAGRIGPLRLATGCPEVTQWCNHFGSVISIAPVVPQERSRRVAFVDLINDEVVACEKLERSEEEALISRCIEEFAIRRDMGGFMNSLPAAYAVRNLVRAAYSDNVIQHAPNLDRRVDVDAH